MATCIPLTEEKIRAEVWLGDRLLAKTPFITTLNVGKARSQLTNTFSVTFEMIAGTAFILGQQLTIKAGIRGQLKSIFTGYIETSQVSPAFAKPSYFSILLSGKGVLSELENKRFTRRLKSDGQGMFCMITGGSANRPSAVASIDRSHSSGNRHVVNDSPNPAVGTGGEQSQLTQYTSTANSFTQGGASSNLAGKPSGGPDENSSSTSTDVHTHEDMDTGGPAFGVYASD